jgi:hypothetical protein
MVGGSLRVFLLPPSLKLEKNGMGNKIYIMYISNSFIVNILSPREGKCLSNYLLHP